MENKCSTCGYIIKGPDQQRLYDMYGCARTMVTQNMGVSIEMCNNDFGTGRFYAPGTNPNTIEEDPDAFKETYAKMVEQRKPKKNGNAKE